MNHFGNREFPDIHGIMEEVFATAEDIRDAVANEMGFGARKTGNANWSEQKDFYPAYSYPPLNVYMTAEKAIVFQFALAGFEEKDITLEFRGDYMIFSAKAPVQLETEEGIQYLKRRLKLKGIDEQKYFVPADKFSQEKTKAVLKNAILTVTVPAKEVVKEPAGFTVPIFSREGAQDA